MIRLPQTFWVVDPNSGTSMRPPVTTNNPGTIAQDRADAANNYVAPTERGVQALGDNGSQGYLVSDANGYQTYVPGTNPNLVNNGPPTPTFNAGTGDKGYETGVVGGAGPIRKPNDPNYVAPKPAPPTKPGAELEDDVPEGPPPGGAPLGGAPTQPTQPSQGNGIGTTNPYAGANYVAYDPDGNPYYIGSDRGMEFLNGAQNGSSITGADGSTWTKDANGNVVIVGPDGRTYTIPGASINASTTPVQNGQVGRLNKEDYFNNGRQYLDAQRDAAAQQIQLQKDYAVQQGVNELQRAEEDAQQQFQIQRNQVARDEQRGLDNQALYAEARGDKGGIGYAQYAAIQAQAAQNRLTINQAQTKLSTDTARQIADLRAQGEFEAADALLSLTQTYLGQLQQLYENSMAYGLDVDKFNLQLEQWEQEYGAQIASLTGTFNGAPTYAAQQDMANAALALLQAGMDIGDAQKQALLQIYGYDENTINNIRMQAQLAAAGVGGGGGRGSGGGGGNDTASIPQGTTGTPASASADPIGYLFQNGYGADFNAAVNALLMADYGKYSKASATMNPDTGEPYTLAELMAMDYVNQFQNALGGMTPGDKYLWLYNRGYVDSPTIDWNSVYQLGRGRNLTENDLDRLLGEGAIAYEVTRDGRMFFTNVNKTPHATAYNAKTGEPIGTVYGNQNAGSANREHTAQ